MPFTPDTLRNVIDALPEHIAAIDGQGYIIATNAAWRGFAADNGAAKHPSLTTGASYLDPCREAVARGDPLAEGALDGIEGVMAGRSRRFALEYPCHGENVQRWFVMTAVRASADCTVLSHADVTRLKQTELALRAGQEQLRASHAQLAAIATCAPLGLGLCDQHGRWIFTNPFLSRITGDLIPSMDPEQSRLWETLDSNGECVPPRNWPGARALRGEVVAPGLEFKSTAGGHERWFSITAAPVRDGADVSYAVLIFEDITPRKRADEQLKQLMYELKHRSKNLLSVVLSVARMTAGGEHADFVRALDERVHALALSQDLLFRGDTKGVLLAELIRSQLAHFGDLLDLRITLEGPTIELAPNAAQTLGMVLHELSTNAAKYGALSAPLGRINIDWSVEGELFRLKWQETGGPSVAPPTRTGYGSTVIGRMAEMNLAAHVSIAHDPVGLVWTLQCALESLSDGAHEQ